MKGDLVDLGGFLNLNVKVKVDLEFLLDFFSLFAVFHVSLAISARLEFGMLRYSS